MLENVLLIIVYSINFNAINYSLSLFSMRKKGNDIYIMVLLFVHIGSKKNPVKYFNSVCEY